jgi:para-nitrobenzyl esterase
MKGYVSGLSALLILAATPSLAQTPGANRAQPVKATIDAGVLVGETRDGVNTFRGVPFAKPPVGALRWKAPQKPDTWTYERTATAFGSACPQVTNPDGVTANGGGVAGATNEDCLYLNVFAPANAQNAPVYVWLYGGASRLGGAHLGGYNGTPNAKQGVITVTVNYRLGPLGGFSHPALTKEAAKNEGLGSFALMDAVAALGWVKRNAAAFGGDPNNVTLGGQSAGGGMVTQLLSIPSAKGLYHKAIIESGAALRPGTPLAEAEKTGAEAIKAAFGLDEKATAAQLRALDAASLVNKSATANSLGSPIDGRFKTISTVDALNAGTEIDVPVMVGSNSGEGGFDGARRLASLAGDSGAGAWLYHFAYVPAWRTEWRQGAVHSAELMFAFGTTETSSWAKGPNGSINDADRAVAKKVNSCWVAFFKMDPKARSLTCADGFVWPAYTDAGDDAAQFKATPALVKSKTIPNGPPAAGGAAPAAAAPAN